MQTSGGTAVGGNVVPTAHLSLVVLPPHGGSGLVKVLAVEPDAGQGVLTIAQACKGQEDALQVTDYPDEQHAGVGWGAIASTQRVDALQVVAGQHLKRSAACL